MTYLKNFSSMIYHSQLQLRKQARQKFYLKYLDKCDFANVVLRYYIS